MSATTSTAFDEGLAALIAVYGDRFSVEEMSSVLTRYGGDVRGAIDAIAERGTDLGDAASAAKLEEEEGDKDDPGLRGVMSGNIKANDAGEKKKKARPKPYFPEFDKRKGKKTPNAAGAAAAGKSLRNNFPSAPKHDRTHAADSEDDEGKKKATPEIVAAEEPLPPEWHADDNKRAAAAVSGDANHHGHPPFPPPRIEVREPTPPDAPFRTSRLLPARETREEEKEEGRVDEEAQLIWPLRPSPAAAATPGAQTIGTGDAADRASEEDDVRSRAQSTVNIPTAFLVEEAVVTAVATDEAVAGPYRWKYGAIVAVLIIVVMAAVLGITLGGSQGGGDNEFGASAAGGDIPSTPSPTATASPTTETTPDLTTAASPTSLVTSTVSSTSRPTLWPTPGPAVTPTSKAPTIPPTPGPIPTPRFTPRPTPHPPAAITEPTRLTGEEVHEFLITQAVQWQSDAVLSEIATVGWLDAEGRTNSWNLKFWSPSTGFIIDMYLYDGVLTSTKSSLPVPDAVVANDAILDTKRLYDIGRDAGGGQFLAEGYRPMAGLVRYPLDETRLAWYLNYSGGDYRVVFTVVIDAKTGEVILATTR